MLIILLKIFFGLAILAALGVSISILISMIVGPRKRKETIRQLRYRAKTLKIKGKYYVGEYQYE